jgi:hypothetical protein
MSVARSVAKVLAEHVTYELEGIDRMYLNVYVPQLQRELGVVSFFRYHRGHTFASSALMAPISKQFVQDIEEYAAHNHVPIVKFEKGQRKDDVMRERLGLFANPQGVVFIGKAQEKVRTFRTRKRRDERTGVSYPWIVGDTAIVNQFYFYCLDEDFGPFFLKFSSYFPYNAKLCINGHEYLKRQLDKEGIRYDALDNGLLRCDAPARAQQICDRLSAAKIDALLRKWLRRLPHPFTAEDRRAGYLYDVSILQAEFSLTQVLDRPLTGRIFFEEVIRENLDIGRPSQVQLIFDRHVTKRTPGRFRTRVITEGVTPSLHIDYKHSRIKQYHKEQRALRTETTINDTRDFGIGKRLKNLPALRQVGFEANRRLLDVQRISHDCHIGEDAFVQSQTPVVANSQRASALRFGDPKCQVLLAALVLAAMLPSGFNNYDLRAAWAWLMGIHPDALTQGKMTYQLRRLRLHGFIARIPHSHSYEVTFHGLRTALFFTRVYARLLRPGLSHLLAPPDTPVGDPSFKPLNRAIDHLCKEAHLAA